MHKTHALYDSFSEALPQIMLKFCDQMYLSLKI